MTVVEILEDLGVKAEWVGDSTLELNAANAYKHEPTPSLCARVRASVLLMGPLLARFGKMALPLPGGDVIGARRIDSHWEGFIALGAKLDFGPPITGQLKKALGTDIYMDEPSVTATENLLLGAALCEGKTTIHNAAAEPHVVGLGNLLNAMGAKITGLGSSIITIEGVSSLSGATHEIGPDFMEVGSFLCLGAIGGGTVKIEDVRVADLRFILKTLEKIGIQPKIPDEKTLVIEGVKPLKMQNDLGGRVGTIYSCPWPAFPTDLMSVAIVAATQSNGTKIFFEKMFEGRMFFTDKLMSMGANIVLCDPHRIVVTGPATLFAAHLSSPDVRAGMALLMAALIAKGTSVIDNIYQIERGYMDIAKKLEGLGAKIERVSYS